MGQEVKYPTHTTGIREDHNNVTWHFDVTNRKFWVKPVHSVGKMYLVTHYELKEMNKFAVLVLRPEYSGMNRFILAQQLRT